MITLTENAKDYLTDIIEESGDVVFASSNVLLKIEKRELHSRAKWISIYLGWSSFCHCILIRWIIF